MALEVLLLLAVGQKENHIPISGASWDSGKPRELGKIVSEWTKTIFF